MKAKLANGTELDGTPEELKIFFAEPPSGKEWSDEECGELVNQLEGGVPVEEIAKNLGRTKSAIAFRITKLRNAGLIAKKTNWTKKEETTILRMSKEGSSLKEIGQKVGRSANAVSVRLAKLRNA